MGFRRNQPEGEGVQGVAAGDFRHHPHHLWTEGVEGSLLAEPEVEAVVVVEAEEAAAAMMKGLPSPTLQEVSGGGEWHCRLTLMVHAHVHGVVSRVALRAIVVEDRANLP